MKIGIIGRTKIIYDTIKKVVDLGHSIAFIVTSKEASEYSIKSNDLEKLAAELYCPFLSKNRLDVEEIKSLIGNENVPLVLSVNYSGIISKEIIELFDLGILNAHGGDLPRYRGNACQAWAILNGETKIGLCVHKMIGGELDSGNIIARKHYPISINTRIGQVYEWFENDIPNLFVEALKLLEKNKNYCLEIQSKNPSDILRCYPRMPEDGRIDWTKSNIEILRLINVSSEPYEGAFTFLNEIKVIIWRAEIVNDFEAFLAIPGQICKNEKDFIDVACGVGKIRLLNISTTQSITSIRNRFN